MTAPLAAASTRLLTHPNVREGYPEFLITLHGVIRGSVPLMQSALHRAQAIAPHDPVAHRLSDYLERHIEEERGHDEWVLEDLEVLGIDRDQVLSRVPTSAVACLVGSQYFWALHFHPVAVLGYLAVTEGYPNAPRSIEQLITSTGLPPPAFRTLLDHAELDPTHGDELDELIDSLPLSPAHEEVIGLSAMSSVDLMARCIHDVCDATESGSESDRQARR